MAPIPRSSAPEGRRSLAARVLATLALAASIIAIVVVVANTLPQDDGRPDREREPRQERVRQEPKLDADTYVVIPGDTLTGIAEKTGYPLARLERLNPDLDPQTLNAGETIRLR